MAFYRVLGTLCVLGALGVSAAHAQCTAQQGSISVTLDSASPLYYAWTIQNTQNGNGNRLREATFEIASADTATTATMVANWNRSIETVDGAWTGLRFSHASGPGICSGGGGCGSSLESFTYALYEMIPNVRIRTTKGNGHTTDFVIDGSLAGCSVLPVELTTFDAVVDNGRVQLRWSTASEVNTAGFSVEGRTGESFEEVAFVSALGSHNVGHDYLFDHRDDERQTNAYRLRMIDTDGSLAYSGIVEVPVPMTQAITLLPAYPNPLTAGSMARVRVAREQHVRVDIFDLTGRLVATPFEGVMAGGRETPVSLDASGLAPGMYFVRASGSSGAANGKAVVVGG